MDASHLLKHAGTGLWLVWSRLYKSVPVILGIALINFLLLNLAPGDAADVMAGESGSASPEYLARLERILNRADELDRKSVV